MIDLFEWNEDYLTDIAAVDQQHKNLVDIINNLIMFSTGARDTDLEKYLSLKESLLDYAEVHFADEENIMKANNVDLRHVEMHKKSHKNFTREVVGMISTDELPSGKKLKQIADYLVYWLAYHILEVDKSMARQVLQIEKGKSPADVYEAEFRYLKSSKEPILKAMMSLFSIVSENNRELKILNEELELRVQQRTEELERANRHLRILATQDDLTDLPNRRFAVLSLDQMILDRNRYKNEFSILLIDADNFKKVNDTFGHKQGDEVIKELAVYLRSSVRGSDIVCRLGGDEFLIICPHCTRETAITVGEKILKNKSPVKTPDGTVCWEGSLSIGVAEADLSITGSEELIKIADKAMYKSKSMGGSCIS